MASKKRPKKSGKKTRKTSSKKTTTKASSKKRTAKKASSKKRAAKKTSSKKRSVKAPARAGKKVRATRRRRPRSAATSGQTVTPPGAAIPVAVVRTGYSWTPRSASAPLLPRKSYPALPSGSRPVKLLGSGSPDDRAVSVPRSGPWVGPMPGWPQTVVLDGQPKTKSAWAQKMAAARAAKAAERAAAKAGKKASRKKRASSPAATPAASTPARPKPSKKKRKKVSSKPKATRKKRVGKASAAGARKVSATRKRGGLRGWPRAGNSKRTFGIPKLAAMNSLGVPPNHPRARAKVAKLRDAAGKGITAAQVFEMANSTNMKAWICAGLRRTGCGGGSKMLRGSHQIGVFGVPARR